MVRCEGNLDEESDEEAKSDCAEDRTVRAGPSKSRQTKKVLQAEKVEAVHDVDDIISLLLKYHVKDETQLIRKMTTKEKIAFNLTKLQTKEWNKVWEQARQLAITSVMDKTWEEVLEMLPDECEKYTPPVMTVNKSIKTLIKILSAQGYDKEQRLQFLKDVYAVMNNNIFRKKRNTLYMIGAVSAGKTLIATSLERSKIYSFNTGEYNARSSDFHWEDMALACIAVINEPQIEAGKVDKFKIILEGGAFDTNVKFKSKSRVEGVPVIVTTNQEIYRYALEAEPAFRERWYRHTFKQTLPHIDISGGLHPKMWLELIKHCQLNKKAEQEESDSECDLEAELGTFTEKAADYTEDISDISDTEMQLLDEIEKPKPANNTDNDQYTVVEIVGKAVRERFEKEYIETCAQVRGQHEADSINNWADEPEPDEYTGWDLHLEGFPNIQLCIGQDDDPNRYNKGSGSNYFTTMRLIIGSQLFNAWYMLGDWVTFIADNDDHKLSFYPDTTEYRCHDIRGLAKSLLESMPLLTRHLSVGLWYGGQSTSQTITDHGLFTRATCHWMQRATEFFFEHRGDINGDNGMFNAREDTQFLWTQCVKIRDVCRAEFERRGWELSDRKRKSPEPDDHISEVGKKQKMRDTGTEPGSNSHSACESD